MRRGAQLILKDLASLHNTKISISEDLFIQARATALDLLEDLNRIEKNISKERKTTSKELAEPSIDKMSLQVKYAEGLTSAKKEVNKSSMKEGSITSTRARLISLPHSKDFPQALDELVKEYGDTVTVKSIKSAEIEHFVAEMPIPGTEGCAFWNEIPKEKLMSTLSSLSKMLDIYALCLRKKEGITAKEANTSYALYAIIHYLALAQEKFVQQSVATAPKLAEEDIQKPISEHACSLADFPIYFPGMEDDEDPYIIFTSLEDYTRRQNLIDYFKDFNANKSNPTFFTPRSFYAEHSYWKTRAKEKHPPAGLIKYLLALTDDPRFDDLVTKEFLMPKRDNYHPTYSKLVFPLLNGEMRKGLLVQKLIEHLPGRNDQSKLFFDRDRGYVPILARAATISKFMNQEKERLSSRDIEDFGEHVVNLSHASAPKIPQNFSLHIHEPDYAKSSYNREKRHALYPALRPDQISLFDLRYTQRNKNIDTTYHEAKILSETNSSKEEITNEIAFLRGSCEPSLFPYKLLAYYKGRLDLFESFEEQTLFELALFRSVALDTPSSSSDNPYSRKRFFPLADELQQKSFQDQARLFILEGLDRNFFSQPNQKPKVLAATMFIRLATRLSSFTEGKPLINSLDLVEKMMANPAITDEERSLLSLHMIHAYSTLNRDLTQEEVEKVFGAWVFYNNTAIDTLVPEKWRNLLLEREVITFIHEISASLPDNQEDFQRSILATGLKQLGVELPSTFKISAKEPHLIEGKGSETEHFTINLLTGGVMSAEGVLRRVAAPKGLEAGAAFVYILGKSKPSYFEANGCYYFSHPSLGAFRALKLKNDTFCIQKQFDGQWYQYTDLSRHFAIPRFLSGDRTQWINISEIESDAIICERSNGNIVATISQAGKISSNDKSTTYWGVDQQDSATLNAFEEPKYMYWSIDKNKKKTLTFWRYQSHSHNPLSFELINNQLVFTANRKYVLSKQQKPGLLGTKNGSFVLINPETGAEKVIVAARPLSAHTPLVTQHQIKVEDASSISSLVDQNNCFEFLEFDVKQNTLLPVAQEGTSALFLAYQYLAQRRYTEAHYWLKQVDFRDKLSERSQTFLAGAISIAGSTDRSPEAVAVALHAWVLYAKAQKRMQAEGKLFDTPPSNHTILNTYSSFIHQIPENLLLNKKDLEFCGYTQKTKKLRHYPHLNTFLPDPLQAQEAIDYKPEKNIEIFLGLAQFPSHLGSEEQKKILKTVQEGIFLATDFIPLEPQPSNFYDPHVLNDGWTTEFEQGFFPTAYEIARKRQGTDLDRQLLAFKMQTAKKSNSWKFLQLALKYPGEAPDLPEAKDYKGRYQFLINCSQLYKAKGGGAPENFKDLKSRAHADVSLQDGPLRPISAPEIAPREAKIAKTPLELADFSKEFIDGEVTQNLFNTYFTEDPRHKNGNIAAPSAPQLSVLEEEEKAFFNILENDFKEFKEDYDKGVEINKERKFYKLGDTQALGTNLETEIKKWDNQIAAFESSILELANKHDPNAHKQTLYKEAKIEQELSLKRLADLFLQGDADAFAKANPYSNT